MIPDDAKITPDVGYRRILLPLDGSSRAETALQKTITLARAEAAELILCYVIPDSGLTEFGQKDPEAESLHRRVRKQNELSGTTYLARIKKRLEQSGLKVSVRISHAGDARRALLDVMTQEKVDFVVMATHGQSGYKDVPTGDVARFLLDRADTPVLLVRPRNGHTNNHAFGDVLSTGARLPSGTD
ncbi:universal stress protein [bacterium]|nr:universal stress protein [bacterium]